MQQGTSVERPRLRCLALSQSAAIIAKADHQLSEQERARSQRFMRVEDSQRFVLGRWLLRDMLRQHYGIDPAAALFDQDRYGKPRLRGRDDIVFSISHSGDWVYCAVGSQMDIGIDVERHRPDVSLLGIGRKVFTAEECHRLEVLSPTAAVSCFYRQWVSKEALVKALGTGLSLEPRRFAIDTEESPAKVRFVGEEPDDVGQGWHIEFLPAAEGYSAALAFRPLH